MRWRIRIPPARYNPHVRWRWWTVFVLLLGALAALKVWQNRAVIDREQREFQRAAAEQAQHQQRFARISQLYLDQARRRARTARGATGPAPAGPEELEHMLDPGGWEQINIVGRRQQ